jgi:hypothetical protein
VKLGIPTWMPFKQGAYPVIALDIAAQDKVLEKLALQSGCRWGNPEPPERV